MSDLFDSRKFSAAFVISYIAIISHIKTFEIFYPSTEKCVYRVVEVHVYYSIFLSQYSHKENITMYTQLDICAQW